MHHDLVGALEDLVYAQVTQESLNRVILQVAVATVHLQAVVNDVEALVSGKLFGHGAVHRVVGVLGLDQPGTVTDHQARRFKVSRHFSELELQVLVSRDRLSKLLPSFDVLCGCLDAGSCSTKRAASNV